MIKKLSLAYLLIFSLGSNAHADFFKAIGEGLDSVIDDIGTAISGEELYSLTIKTTPGATVRIMNISPKYKNGIKLAPGNYDILVEKKGYISIRKWIKITDSDMSTYIRLTKEDISLDKNTSSPMIKDKLKKSVVYAKVGEDGIPEIDGGYLQVGDNAYLEMHAKSIYKTKIIRGTVSKLALQRLPDYHYVTNKHGIVVSSFDTFKGITIKGSNKYKNFSLHPLKKKTISQNVGLYENNGSAKKGDTIYVPGKKIAISKKSLGSDIYLFAPKKKLDAGLYVAWTEGKFWLFELEEVPSISKGVDSNLSSKSGNKIVEKSPDMKTSFSKSKVKMDTTKFNSTTTELDKNGLPDYDGGYIKLNSSSYIEMESKPIYKSKLVDGVMSKARKGRLPYSYYVTDKNGAAISTLDQFNGFAIKGPYNFEGLSLYKLSERKITDKTELIENTGPAKVGDIIYVISERFKLRKKSLGRDIYYFVTREKLSTGVYVARIGSTFWIFQLN